MRTISTGLPPALLASILVLVACQSPPPDPLTEEPSKQAGAPAREADPPPHAPEAFTFVILTDGPASESLSEDAIRQAAEGHRANIERLGNEGVLLLAGPFGETKTDPTWRGIFVFDEADLEQAEALTASDPAVEVGAFAMRTYPWQSASDLRRFRQLSQARKENDEPFEGRAYVLGLGTPAADTREVIAGLVTRGLVPIHGTLGGVLDDHELFVLAVETEEEALELLTSSGNLRPTWQLHPWYASALLMKLVDDGSL